MFRRLWCRLFHKRHWRIAGEASTNAAGTVIWRGIVCLKCCRKVSTASNEKLPPQTFFMFKASDPNDWNY